MICPFVAILEIVLLETKSERVFSSYAINKLRVYGEGSTKKCSLLFMAFAKRSETGLSAGGTRGDRWSPWRKNEKIREDQGGPACP